MPARQLEQAKAIIQEDTMNTPTIVRTINSHWLRRGIVAAAALLIASAAALGLANRPSVERVPASMPATRMGSAGSAAQRRYEDFKRRQVEGLEEAGVSALSAAQLRYEDFKLRQIDQHGATTTQHATAAQTRFIDFKLRQIDP
jgi:hypothetical protein